MKEDLLAMSCDFENEFSAYALVSEVSAESVDVTIVECGTENCTALLC